MDGTENREIAPTHQLAASPAWFPTVTGGSAWWRPAEVHHRTAAADRRLSRRVIPTGAAMALLRPESECLPCIDGMNMGAIGMAVLKVNPFRLGKIKDVSRTGLAFYYVDAAPLSSEPCRLDILLAEKGFYLKDMDFAVVSDIRCVHDSGFDAIPVGQLCVRFQHITPRQQQQLDHFITAFTQGKF